MIDACCAHSHLVNSGVTEPNLTKFLNNVDKLLLYLIFWNRNCYHAIGFGTPVSRMKVRLANFANLATKLVGMATSL